MHRLPRREHHRLRDEVVDGFAGLHGDGLGCPTSLTLPSREDLSGGRVGCVSDRARVRDGLEAAPSGVASGLGGGERQKRMMARTASFPTVGVRHSSTVVGSVGSISGTFFFRVAGMRMSNQHVTGTTSSPPIKLKDDRTGVES